MCLSLVDINKGDEENPEYRSRLVAKEIKKNRNRDLFAATPPIEAKQILMSMAMAEGLEQRLVCCNTTTRGQEDTDVNGDDRRTGI